MPRDPSGNYSTPVGTDGVPNFPIESSKYNVFVHDVETDLNAPRPIVVGGTNATSADGALDNLSAEKKKQIVTNWDSMVWMAGSFYADSTATGIAPVVGRAFAGICYYANATDFVCEATDVTDNENPDQYVRVMKAGVWGAWTKTNDTSDLTNLGHYVFDSGITFPPASGQIRFNNATQDVSVTEVFISHTTASGNDNVGPITFLLKAGSDLIVQDKDEGPKFKVFTAMADPIVSGGDFRITVTFKTGSVDLVSAQHMLVGTVQGGNVLYTVPQTLTQAQKLQARSNIFAAPFDAMAYNGMQVNGAMEVSQINGINSIALTSGVPGHVVDSWICQYSHPTAQFVARQQPAGSTVLGGTFGYFQSVIIMTTSPTTPMTSVATTDYVIITQLIEGVRVARLGFGTAGAQPFTVGFWIAATVGGTASLSVRGGTPTRSYAAEFTIVGGSVWQYITITIPGDTGGTAWERGFLTGINLAWVFASGASWQVPAGVWTNGNLIAVPTQSNFFSTINNAISFGGVVVLPGSQAPSAELSPMIVRPYDYELLSCQRYLSRSYPAGSANGAVNVSSYVTMTGYGTQALGNFTFPATMRATPTLNIWGFSGTPGAFSNLAGTDITAATINPTSWGFAGATLGVSQPTGTGLITHYQADARLA